MLSAREVLLARHPPEVLPDRLVESWRLRVWGDLGDHPPSGAEQRRADPPFTTLYAATLVAASVAGETLTLLQIGSGDLLVGSGRGSRVLRPFRRPQRHHARGDGHSLSDQYAAAHVRIRTVDLGRVELDVVLLSAPGMDAAHADGRHDAATLADLVEDLRGRTGADLAEEMERVCAQRSDARGESMTVALLVRDCLPGSGRRGSVAIDGRD